MDIEKKRIKDEVFKWELTKDKPVNDERYQKLVHNRRTIDNLQTKSPQK